MVAASPAPSARQDVLHLFALSAIAVAQPVFDLLGRYATFFVAHGAQPRDIAAFALAVATLPPVALALLELAAGAISARARRALHAGLVAVLLAAVVLPPLHRAIVLPPLPAFALAGAAGVLGAFAYTRLPALRAFVTVLSPVVVIFPLLFLYFSPVTALVQPERPTALAAGEVRNRAPIVFVIFDEFSLFALMDADHQIDAARFPNFAALARTATWYRNATSVADYTPTAVPAILTGALPDHSRLPTAREHPHNLFTLLGGAYDLHLFEAVTELCPPDLCPQGSAGQAAASPVGPLLADAGLIYLHMITPVALRGGLPDIQRQWTFQFTNWNFLRILSATINDRTAQFTRFVKAIEPGAQPGLFFLHILLPHYPYQYFPSGVSYEPPPPDFGHQWVFDPNHLAEDLTQPAWASDNPEGARQEQERYLLQVEYVDRLLGQLLDHLRERGLFDETLLVVTADHGVSFRPGVSERYVTEDNHVDIMAVPLFIKAPYQRTGRIDDRNVETIDIVPTVAGLLGTALPWPVDGHDLQDGALEPRSEKVIFTPVGRSNQLDLRRLAAPAAPLEFAALEHQLALFGTDAPLDGGAPSAPLRALLGQPIEAVPRSAGRAPFSVELDRPERFATVDAASGSIPAFVRGRLHAATPPAPPHTPLAIAVNGVVRAVTESLPDGQAAPAFGALVLESAWRTGANTVEVFAVVPQGDALTLAPLNAGPAPAP